MKAETKKLAALINRALQKNSFIPVTGTEIQIALNAIEIALQIMPCYNDDPAKIKNNLQQAIRVLSNLIYMLNNNLLGDLCNDHRSLVNRAGRLCKQANGSLSLYCNTPGVQYKLLPVKILLKTLQNINNTFQQNASITELYTVVQPHLPETQRNKSLPYHRWIWWSHFAAVIADKEVGDSESLQDLLVKLNFNTVGFINWLLKKLQQQIEEKQSNTEKLALVTEKFLWYHRVDSFADGYMLAENSVKRVMVAVLQNQLLFLRTIPSHPFEYSKPQLKKLNTALSVPQLALLIRLMVDTKIINDTNYSALLKNVAAVMYTSKAASVSAESLRVNYYTPGNAAKSILKDYLLNMINLLRTY